MLTHYNLIANILQWCDGSQLEVGVPGEVGICVLPLFHIAAASCCMNSGMYTGQHLIVLPGFTPELFCGSIQKYKIQRLYLVPPLVNFLTKSPMTATYDLSSIKLTGSGGMYTRLFMMN